MRPCRRVPRRCKTNGVSGSQGWSLRGMDTKIIFPEIGPQPGYISGTATLQKVLTQSANFRAMACFLRVRALQGEMPHEQVNAFLMVNSTFFKARTLSGN